MRHAQTIIPGSERNGAPENDRDLHGLCGAHRSGLPAFRGHCVMNDAESSERSFVLLRRAQAGDSQAIERIIARYHPRIERWASGRLPGYARSLLDTGDVIQEAMIKVIRNLPRIQINEEKGLLPYFRKTIDNLVRDEIRKHARMGGGDALQGNERAPGPSPLEEAIGRDVRERYERALAKLRPEEQHAILLRVELDCDWAFVADEMGKPTPDAARVAVSRALVRLAEELSRGS